MPKEPGYWVTLYYTGLPAKEEAQATPGYNTEVLAGLDTTRRMAIFLQVKRSNVSASRQPSMLVERQWHRFRGDVTAD